MAFQMIPPRLSSSPPPLDSLPPVACPGEDEDDEFAHFSSHNASFDITGLSDKLPPTPESSPSRFPGIRLGSTSERGLTEGLEGTLEDSISQDSGVDSSNHPHEFSPQPQGDGHSCSREDMSGGDGGRADRELSDIEQNDMDDFGDFQGVCTADTESLGEREQECLSSMAGNTSQDWNSSQISSQSLPQGSENSRHKESESSIHRIACSPPPLDCVKVDAVIEDGFSSGFPLADDEADFGDFASHEAAFDLPSGTNNEDKLSSESSFHPHDYQPVSEIDTIESDHEEMASSTSAHQIGSMTEQLQADGDSEDSSAWKPSRVVRSMKSQGSEDEQQGEESFHSPPKEFLRSEEETEVDNSFTSEVTQTLSLNERDERGMADGMASSQGNTREDSGENTVVAPTTSASDDGVDEEQRTGDRLGLKEGGSSLSGNESAVSESDRPGKESDTVVKGREGEGEPLSDTTERFGELCGYENESDFGDFNQAEDGDGDDDDDDDDLDFADLRKQVEEGTFGDFGDFSTGFGDGNDSGGGGGGDGDADGGDDFGDFTASADTKSKAGFDDFGDFVVHGKESAVEDDFTQDFSDGFGDFSAPENSEALRGFTTAAVEEPPQFQAQDDGIYKPSPILQKLECLVAKWIPRTPGTSQEESCPVPLLHQTIESDAFVWRQLENLESSAALRLSWGNTQAHNFFLSSVNVDARNILFGQKWSSSVPLFAQTLSFSPLTPAKSTEGSGGGGGSGGVGLAGATKELPQDTFPTATTKHKQNSFSDSSSISTNGGSEEQIPPAKFDWTSSGLTNPLEGPGLEQEFLSEGGDKGSGGRTTKSPPTPSPLVQQILGRGMSKVPSPATPLQSLAPEVRQVVTQLPNLSFMRSRVLMFPIRGDQ